MKTAIVALKCWFLAVVLNAMLLGVSSFVSSTDTTVQRLLTVGFIVLVGSIVSSPLLIAVVPLVFCAKKLPYPCMAQACWLACMLTLVGVSFITVFLMFIVGLKDMNKETVAMLTCIPISIGLSVIINRRSFYKLSNQRYE